MEPEVEVDEFVGLGEIDLLRVSLYLEDLFFRDFQPFLQFHSLSLMLIGPGYDVVRL